jgi:hypothetical protein
MRIINKNELTPEEVRAGVEGANMRANAQVAKAIGGKAKIRQNIYGNWYGYIGARKVEMFFGSGGCGGEQEFQAKQWLAKMKGGQP